MALDIALNLPTTEPPQTYLTLDNWKRGVITLIDQSRLPRNALKEAINIFLYEDGMPGPRPGVGWYNNAPTFYSTGTVSQADGVVTGVGTTLTSAMEGMTIVYSTGETATITSYTSATSMTVTPSQTVGSTTYVINAPIDGVDYFDFNGVSHLVCVAGGKIFRSTDDAVTWALCSGATLTAGTKCYFEQNGSYLYITNGIDNITRYDGSTTLQTYTALTTPGAPTPTFAGAGTSFDHYYKIAAVNAVGMSIASASGTDNAGLTRENFDATTNKMTVTYSSVVNATRYDIYYSDTSTGTFFYLGSSSTTTFIDDGSWILNPSVTAPTENSTQGPKVEELTNVGSRMYGVRDADNKYRIWFTGTGSYGGAFSSAYDGGYLDWQEGGKYIPMKVADYRDGRGTPYATVWCDSSDGQGCILQMSLDTLTVADISITVPAAYKLPGSRGTPAPGSVVNVLNDFYFYNSQAYYNLGSRANLQQLLSTDEVSANIRPSVKRISQEGEADIATAYSDARIFFSVPIGSSVNNTTMVYDTERKAWLPEAFNIGFSKFLKYTDGDMSQRLLALKPGDTRLSEISSNIQGDYGVAFSTSLVTGLYPVTRNRFEFSWTREGEIEFSNPQGEINIELLGIQRTQGFSSTNTTTIETTLSTTGHSTRLHSAFLHSDTSDALDTFSESSIKRYFRVQKELNAVQWRVTTSSLSARYVLRTMQTNGTLTQGGKPREWRI
jgi:hypothetical protein